MGEVKLNGYPEGTEKKPDHPGQLYLRDIQRLQPNTELIAHLLGKFNVHATYTKNNTRLNDEDRYNTELPVQFISTKIMQGDHRNLFWHALVRNLRGQEFHIDLGNYGAVRWEGTYNPHRWLTLKE